MVTHWEGYGSRRSQYPVTTSINVSDDLYQKVKEIGKKERVSLSVIARTALIRFVDKYEKEAGMQEAKN